MEYIFKNKKDIGTYGERVAAHFLTLKGHRVLAKNLRLKQGEIDILTYKNGVIHIIEVKTTYFATSFSSLAESDIFLPEDNLSSTKLRKLYRLREELMNRLEMGIGLDRGILDLGLNLRPDLSVSEMDIEIGGVVVYLHGNEYNNSEPYLEGVEKCPPASTKTDIKAIKVKYFPYL